MLGVVALRALAVPGQLSLCPFPGLGSNDRGYPHWNPCSLRASRPALTVAGVAIFEPVPPMGASGIPGLRTIVIGLPLIERESRNISSTLLWAHPRGEAFRGAIPWAVR